MSETLAKSISDIVTNDVFYKPVPPMEPPEVVQTWSILDTVEKLIVNRKEECRAVLMDEALKGEPNATGNYQIEIDHTKVMRESRTENVPKLDVLTELLSLHGIPLEEGCDVTKVMHPSPSKIQRLVERGLLTQGEVDALKKTTQYLRVYKSDALKSALAEMVDRYENRKSQIASGKR